MSSLPTHPWNYQSPYISKAISSLPYHPRMSYLVCPSHCPPTLDHTSHPTFPWQYSFSRTSNLICPPTLDHTSHPIFQGNICFIRISNLVCPPTLDHTSHPTFPCQYSFSRMCNLVCPPTLEITSHPTFARQYLVCPPTLECPIYFALPTDPRPHQSPTFPRQYFF